jgi:hypothetical protein
VILAHAFGQRYELPLPLLYFVAGGAVVVIVSFLVVLPRAVPDAEPDARADHVPSGLQQRAAGVGGVVLLAAVIACGIYGSQDVPENIVPTLFWLVVWIAVPLSCGVIGDWTRAGNPFAALARLADSDGLRKSLLGSPTKVVWPRWLGWWPATVAFFVIACGELVYNQTATLPRVTAFGLLLWAVVSVAMGLLFGAEHWVSRGEVFAVLFASWGRLGFFRFGAPGRRGFGGALDVPFEPAVSRVLFVLLMLVSVSFDGLISTPAWRTARQHINDVTGGSTVGNDTVCALTFLLLALVTLIVFGAFSTLVSRAGGRNTSFLASLADLLPSLVPIAFGYLLAHNIEYLIVNGQLLIPLAGNPAGIAGWHLLPAPFDDSYEADIHPLASAAYWYFAVAVIVAVHVAAVVIAHRHLGRAAASVQRARRSEFPWIVAMAGYTMVSLWLLEQPLVKEKPAPPANEAVSAQQAARTTPG